MLKCSVSALDSALARFESEYVIYELVAKSFAAEVARICADSAISCRTDGRAKDLISFHSKVIDKGYTDPWEQVTDKAGARIILETAADVDIVTDIISSKLDGRIIRVEDKRQISSPESLGYSGVHVQVWVPHEGNKYECELQIRTAAQDLWSTMSHKVLYKPTVELPAPMQHAAYRLVAIMELFDEELERIVQQSRLNEANPVARVSRVAGPHYLRIARATGSGEKKNMILQNLMSAFDENDVENYEAILGAYLSAEETTLREIYDVHGPTGTSRSLDMHPILDHPESLIILERLSCKKHLLVEAWNRAGLPGRYLTSLADVAGVRLPDSD